MPKHFVLTLSGPDKVGIVERMTGLLLERGGNVETSRMARLGGEFAVLMLVAIPSDEFAGLEADLDSLTSLGYKITTTPSEPTAARAHAGWVPHRIEVHGADHEGIIHEIARYLSQLGINIESMDSETTPAPITGAPLFDMTALIVVPPTLPGQNWESGLAEIGRRLSQEISVTAIERE